MPTKTFFNLSEEKKQRLLDAALKEFSRVPVSEASINNIVKTAGIARGSFYQYFNDKEDLYFYFIGILRQDSRNLLYDNFKKAKGNLFEGYKMYFPKLLKWVMNERNKNIYRHMFLNMNYRTTKEVSPETSKKPEQSRKYHIDSLKEIADLERLQLDDEEDFYLLIKFITSLLNQTIGEGFANEESQQTMCKTFNKKINWLENGVKTSHYKEERMND